MKIAINSHLIDYFNLNIHERINTKHLSGTWSKGKYWSIKNITSRFFQIIYN